MERPSLGDLHQVSPQARSANITGKNAVPFSVNSMNDLAEHPHLRRIEVDTPNGKVSYPAPAAIVVGEDRHYGKVPAIGERTKRS